MPGSIQPQPLPPNNMAWFQHVDLTSLNRAGNGGLHEHLGMEFTDFGPDWLSAKMPVDERTKQPFGLLHGGASVALAESVGSTAGSLTIDPNIRRVVGMEINANHLRPVTEGYVHAVAKAESLGRTAQVWTIRITDDADRLICLSRITLAVIATRD
ncbi:MAG: phenylacetic acid degradation-like protein [Sphingomonadales bacterium]|nr:phenylacetic acid degradation-like protein [Sphingomonadales bacterium]